MRKKCVTQELEELARIELKALAAYEEAQRTIANRFYEIKLNCRWNWGENEECHKKESPGGNFYQCRNWSCPIIIDAKRGND
jgi:hypothetical protein